MRFHGQSTLPATVDHEAVGGILQVEQCLDAAVDGLCRKHGEHRVADELDDASTATGDEFPGERVKGAHGTGELGVWAPLGFSRISREIGEGNEEGVFGEI